MTVPTFNGLDCLGLVRSMSTKADPAQRQENSYPGVTGVESVNLGGRGGHTTVEGLLYGYTDAGLAVAQQVLRAAVANATVGALYDDKGKTWPSVILVDFQPIGPVGDLVAPPDFLGYRGQAYKATFRHLI